MRNDDQLLLMWVRGVALVVVTALGLVAIVGSGGGVAFVPSDCPPGLDCNTPPPPQPAASVRPPYVTALVGTPVAFAATTSDIPGTVSYQWSRSSDGGATYGDIAGATGSTYSLPAVNLADDRALFKVTAMAGDVVVQSVAHLAVSATPGLVFEDGEFQVADWLASPVADANEPAPVHTEERVAAGGNPDAYRKMVFVLPTQALSGRVFYTALSATYQPQTQGAIYVIDYSEDCIALESSEGTFTDSSMLIEQAGRRYLANNAFGNCRSASWSNGPGRASLSAQDFRLFDGPVCQAGESCPDFSALGLPMRFGYWRISFGIQGNSIAHGIDNWKVTVWRR